MRLTTQRRPFIGAGILAGHRTAGGDWRLLLFRRAIPPDRGAWSVVGGRQDPGETFGQTAIREAAEEAFDAFHRPDEFARRLAGYLPSPFAIEECRFSEIWFPAAFTYRTYLVELTEEVPPEMFTLNRHECDACRWFSADSLPGDVHWGVHRTVRQLGLA